MEQGRYYTNLASAFVRGRLGERPHLSSEEIIQSGIEAGLRLHKFKRNAQLPRARELAREHLRARERFVWNATNISRHTNSRLIDLVAAYRARVRIVYIETSPDRLYEQNRRRDDAVPDVIIARLLDQWEVPDLTEAHQVDHIAHRY